MMTLFTKSLSVCAGTLLVTLRSITSTSGCLAGSNLKNESAGTGELCLMDLIVIRTLFPSLPKEVTFCIDEVAGFTQIPIFVKLRLLSVGKSSM